MEETYNAKNLIHNCYIVYDETLTKEELETNYIKLEDALMNLFSKYITKIEQG